MRKTKSNRQMIAQERSYNRKYNVKNNCVPEFVKNNYRTVNDDGIIEYKWEKVKSPQPKNLTKGKCFVKKDGKKLRVLSEQGKFHKKYTIKKYDKHSKEYIEAYVQHCITKWKKKNPCPIKLDGIQQDMFNKEFLVPWQQRLKAYEECTRIRLIRKYGQFSLVERYKESDDKYVEYKTTVLSDVIGDVVKNNGINNCPKDSMIVKEALTIANMKGKNPNFISAIIKDDYYNQGRIVLPSSKAA